MGKKDFPLPHHGTFGDPARDVTNELKEFGMGTVFSSSKPKVARIVEAPNGKRMLRVGRAGVATITANAGNSMGVLKHTVTVKKRQHALGQLVVPSGKKVGDSFTLVAPPSPSKGMFMFGSSNPLVVSVIGNKATVKGSGEAFLFVMQMASKNYRSAWEGAMFSGEEYPEPNLQWVPFLNDYPYYGGSRTVTIPAATSNSPQTINYSSKDPTLVTIQRDPENSNYLHLTYYDIGTTTLYAQQDPYDDGEAQYSEASASVDFRSVSL